MFYAKVIESKGKTCAENGEIVFVESVKNEEGNIFYRFKGKKGQPVIWFAWRFIPCPELTLNEYINKRGEQIEQRT